MSPSITVTPADLIRRRTEILERLGMTLEDYKDASEQGAFSGEHWAVRDELQIIAYLLGEEFDID